MESFEEPKINIKWTYGEPAEKSTIKKDNPFSSVHDSISEFAVSENDKKRLSRDFIQPENVQPGNNLVESAKNAINIDGGEVIM